MVSVLTNLQIIKVGLQTFREFEYHRPPPLTYLNCILNILNSVKLVVSHFCTIYLGLVFAPKIY